MALSHLVVQYESNFCTVALQFMEEEKSYPLPAPTSSGTTRASQLIYLPLPSGRTKGPPGRPVCADSLAGDVKHVGSGPSE